MKTVIARLLSAAALLSTAACGGGGGGGGGGSNVVIRGEISGLSAGFGGSPSALADAVVEGLLGGDAIGDDSSNTEGEYTLRLDVDGPQTIVVAVREAGYAPFYRTIDVQPGADIPLSITLRQLDTLDCGASGTCAIDGNKLSIDGLPDGYSGGARVFNPVTESDAFPGGFNDDAGNLLLSGTFAAIELEDDSGNPVDGLPGAVDLRMAFPQDTWSIVLDITPGNGRIDVPMFAFDEELGTWVEEGTGVLEDADGVVLAEADVALLKDGSFDGVVYARASVTHFSYWNVDWPIETHTCVTGTIVDADGDPIAGATVTASGVTYGGTSTPQTTGADGRFCFDVMKSEIGGEDIDQDGIVDETQTISIRVAHQGELYDGGEFATPATQGTCAAGTCTDLGNVSLDATSRLEAGICVITGDVLLDGTGVAGATVQGYDDSIPSEVYTALCGQGQCIPAASSGAGGAYSISVPVISGVSLIAVQQEVVGADQILRYGQRFAPKCPTTPQDISLTDGYAYTTLTVTVTGNTITWDPPRPASYVYVSDSTGGTQKWMIIGDTSLITPPVTYGTVPAGSVQAVPSSGSPAALASGDMVTVTTLGTTSDGLASYGSGQGVAP